jgi:hypothetical protein
LAEQFERCDLRLAGCRLQEYQQLNRDIMTT